MTVHTDLTVTLANDSSEDMTVTFDHVADDVDAEVDFRLNGERVSVSLDDVAEFATALQRFVEHHRPHDHTAVNTPRPAFRGPA